jgi:hypothetical protein
MLTVFALLGIVVFCVGLIVAALLSASRAIERENL